MKRIMLMVTVALMLALMVALPGAALAAQGKGGHVQSEEFGITYIGGEGGSDTGSGFGGLGEEGNGGGGGGCEIYFGERYCGGYGFGPN